MIAVNLVPPHVLAARKRTRKVRAWSIAVAAVAALSAVPALLEVRDQARLDKLLSQKDRHESRVQSAREELAEAMRSLTELNERIERANTLRTKRSWAALFDLVVGSMPDEVWLTSVDTGQPSSAGPASKRTRGPPTADTSGDTPGVVVLDGAGGIVLAGFAVDHEHLYDFMARLKASKAFAAVELNKGVKEPVLRSQAVRFELNCTW